MILSSFQNATAGTKVFQVVAHDPDDPNTSNGKIVYSLPDDGTIIRKLFQLDPGSGVLTTKVRLKYARTPTETAWSSVFNLNNAIFRFDWTGRRGMSTR